MPDKKDIQFLNTKESGDVPFTVTGQCDGRRSAAQKILVMMFTDPDERGYGGGLDPVKILAATDVEGLLRSAAADVETFMRDNGYPDISINVSVERRDRGSMGFSLNVNGETATVVVRE